VEIFALCVMPNHFHLIVRPPDDTALSRWMQWLLTTHVRRRHQLRGTDTHLWQGRYKAFPVERDQHLLTVTRYVERNALRAGLVTRAENWPWSSASWRCRSCSPLDLTPMPIVPPGDWTEWVNEPQTATELEALRICARRQRPFGSPPWVAETATNLALTQSLRPVGRPRKNGDCPH
jgi:putative transposase